MRGATACPCSRTTPYGELRFEGEALPSLLELAPDLVIHAGTFSKIMAPGLRVAWLVAPPEALAPVVRAKQAADLHTSSFTQMVAHEVLESDSLDAQIERVRDYYRKQRDFMLEAMATSFPDEVAWTRPKGGMFLWVTLLKGCDAALLLREAVAEGVAFVPGEAFFANGGGENTLRLSYSVATPEEIDKGIGKLGEVFEKHLKVAASA